LTARRLRAPRARQQIELLVLERDASWGILQSNDRDCVMRASSKILRAAAMAFLLIAPASTRADERANPQTPTQTSVAQPDLTVLWRAESVLGKAVITTAGEHAGRVVDVLADGSGAVQAAVVEVGGFLGVGSRRVAIAWKDLHFASEKRDTLVVELSRERLSEAPEVKTGEPVVAISNAAKGRGAEGAN